MVTICFTLFTLGSIGNSEEKYKETAPEEVIFKLVFWRLNKFIQLMKKLAPYYLSLLLTELYDVYSVLNRVLEPSVLIQMKLSDGTAQNFEVFLLH